VNGIFGFGVSETCHRILKTMSYWYARIYFILLFQMPDVHCVIGTFCNKLMCAKVSDLPSNADVFVGSRLCFANNRDEYLSGKILFMSGM
jgi:hypothetical protein